MSLPWFAAREAIGKKCLRLKLCGEIVPMGVKDYISVENGVRIQKFFGPRDADVAQTHR